MKAFLVFLLTWIVLAVSSHAAPPTRVPSFGPNGTHWPSLIDTPFMYDAATTALVIDVACSWSAIDTALAGIDSTEAAAGVIIRVADGTLTGSGPGEGDTAAISQRGSSSWSKRVTITPLNGQGAVLITSARIDRVKGVCWAGFDLNGVMWHGCDRGAVAWSKSGTSSEGGWVSVYGLAGHPVDSFEIVEVVDRYANTDNYDASDIYTGGANITNMRIEGCYWAPHYLSDTEAHVDCMQFENVSGGSLGSFAVRDCLMFASNNACIQIGSGATFSFVNSALVGGSVSLARYPQTPGSVESGYYGALNGAGSASFTDCLIWDATTGTTVSSVTTSSKSNTASQADGFGSAPASGSWTLDGSMTLAGKGIMDEPSDEYLATIWADPGAGDTSDPIISSIVATVTGQTTATITWTTDEAASSVVDYGLTASYGSTATGSSGVTSHSVALSGLSAGTTYHFRVRSADAANNSAASSDATFTTLSAPAQSPTSLQIIRIAALGKRAR